MIRRVACGLLVVAAAGSPLDSLRVGPLGGVADALFLLAAVTLLVRFLVGGRRVLFAPYIRVILAAAFLAVAGLIGTLFSEATTASLANIARFAVTTIGLPLAFAALRPRTWEVRRLAWAYVLGCSVSGLVSLTEINPVTVRSSGLASHPNVLGLSSALAVPILFGLWDRATGPGRLLAGGCMVALLLGISRSGSRAAVLGVVVGVMVYLFATRRRRALAYVGAGVVVLALSFATGLYRPSETSAIGRVLYSNESTELANAGREELAATVIERIDGNVLTGSGFTNATQAHNVYLQVLDIGGLLGVLAFSAMVAAILRSALSGRADPLVTGALAMYVAYLAAAFVTNTLWDRWLWFPIVIGLAARAALVGSARRPVLALSGAPSTNANLLLRGVTHPIAHVDADEPDRSLFPGGS